MNGLGIWTISQELEGLKGGGHVDSNSIKDNFLNRYRGELTKSICVSYYFLIKNLF